MSAPRSRDVADLLELAEIFTDSRHGAPPGTTTVQEERRERRLANARREGTLVRGARACWKGRSVPVVGHEDGDVSLKTIGSRAGVRDEILCDPVEARWIAARLVAEADAIEDEIGWSAAITGDVPELSCGDGGGDR